MLICTAPQSFILKLKNKNLSCLFILMGFKIIKKYMCFFLLCQISTFESMSFWWKGSFCGDIDVDFLCSHLWWLSKDHHTGDLVASDQVQPSRCRALPQRLCWCVHTLQRSLLTRASVGEFSQTFNFFTGAAIRHCDVERGWLEPDLYNCTSPPFVELNIAVRCSAVENWRL